MPEPKDAEVASSDTKANELGAEEEESCAGEEKRVDLEMSVAEKKQEVVQSEKVENQEPESGGSEELVKTKRNYDDSGPR